MLSVISRTEKVGRGHRSSWLCVQSPHLLFPSPEALSEKAERDQYELLCPDNTRKSVDEYAQCHLAKVPSHAVVARSVDGKEDLIWELLSQAQVSSPAVLSPAWT